MLQFQEANLAEVTALLCDADGNLFPSEEPAFEASASVTNRFLEELGLSSRFTASNLRSVATGKNFRITALSLAISNGIQLSPDLIRQYPKLYQLNKREEGEKEQDKRSLTATRLEWWVEEEKREVITYLHTALSPNPEVISTLKKLEEHYILALVSSSATTRIAASLDTTKLAELFPKHLCFSAEDSLPVATSKPDPAIYLFAAQELGLSPNQGLAIEDSVAGAQSAIRAGFSTIGNVMFVKEEERQTRIETLRGTGVKAIIFDWSELVTLLEGNSTLKPLSDLRGKFGPQ